MRLDHMGRGLRAIACVVLFSAVACSSGHKTETPHDAGANGATEDGSTPETKSDSGTKANKDSGASSNNDSGTQTGRPDGGGSDSGTSSGGMHDAGAQDGGSQTPTDAGHDAGSAQHDAMMADPCANLTNLCTTEGATCMGNTLVTCAMNSDGCLVSTRTNCTRNGTNFCDSTASPPKCAVDPCAGLTNTCTTAGTTCNGTTLVECAANADGCLVTTQTDCTTVSGKNACSGTPSACSFDKCADAQGKMKANVCATPDDSCAGNLWIHCVNDSDGCPIATRTDCTMESGKNICDPNTKACGFDPCLGVTNCLTAGKSCDGVNLVDCEANGDGCLVTSATDCSQMGAKFSCDTTSTPAQCAMCEDAAACAGKAEGDTLCAANVFTQCSDTDHDGCLNAVTEDCGASYTCDTDATKRCDFTTAPTCKSAIDATLREPMTYGPFDTTGAGNDYSNYTCAGLTLFPIGGGSPDRLFAVDIAPMTTVTVTLTSPTGFTGNGPLIFVLTRCDNASANSTAEATCQTVSSTAVTYTNQTTTDTRIYVVVDVDSNATNVGSFGLTLDEHAFMCGDGQREGNEACDDGNLRSGDGCTPTCTLESGYLCTAASPSVCTQRPTDSVCANVACPALPSDVPPNTTMCCTADEHCGVAYALVYGAGCIERDQVGKPDSTCPDATSAFPLFLPTLSGCCRSDNQCGLTAADGGGCVERTETWTDMQDGFGAIFYSGPFLAKSCTYN